ncbi:TadE/TadG family type IV pilus assembly protein [Oceanimonas baumannii]|uniref:Flp pilus-assembly TadE/G-like protein n=1 Tax=Oceanimonas baumannii TaxID=129578 RepID=A0A235CLA0_9GAMM|nr:TadE/TadG family type IV pilus assembly protein [Oceanimonas baumannii]OYD25199.1 hypothetical protein B6S09_05830 [Oceanimonas baumannii]TDW62510.1 putative Flp pilus-assembly TadE/G-like protein [Oceanimonas baumannii]
MKALPTQRKQKGAVLILVTVALFVLLGFTALALDGGYLLLNKSRLQDAVDAAALSGAKTMSSDDASISTHANAEAAALDTLQLILSKDGYGFINVDTTALAAAVVVEFSDDPVPFQPTNNPGAEYIRVRMESVPVTQFLSQIATNIWQVRVSALAGPLAPENSNKVCDVIPLLMCALSDADNFGYTAADVDNLDDDSKNKGDVIVIKSPAPGSSEMGPGNFKAIRIGDSKGADDFRDGLAGGHCIEIGETPEFEVDSTEPGNIHGPTKQGLNSRFGIYKGKIKEPNAPPPGVSGDYYSDGILSSLPIVDFSKTPLDDGESIKLSPGDLLDNDGNQTLQMYKDYVKKDLGYGYKAASGYSIDNRRLVKVPVANCSDAGGNAPVETVGVACMFLNQEADGKGNDMYIAAEFVSKCPSGGSGSGGTGGENFRLVLFDDSDSGDS